MPARASSDDSSRIAFSSTASSGITSSDSWTIAPAATISGHRGLPILGTLDEAGEIAVREHIDHLYVALPAEQHVQMLQLLQVVGREMIDVKVVPDVLQVIALRARLEDLDGIPIINVNDVPLQGFNSFIKRTLDVAISGTALVLFAIPLAIAALVIRRTSPGPIFYRQERMGLDGKQFTIYKFRSMYEDAEAETGPVWARDDDPRCTPVGRLLRKTSIDELPQLWNVLRGDMSLVGPRPERPYFVDQFKQRIPQYMLRHKVRAGLTGWAQVNGWRGNTSIEKRIEYDLYYIENWSVALDIKIMWLTLLKGFFQRHAYQRPSHIRRYASMPQRVVITGAAGFIGSHLAETLLDRGYSVIGIDNLLTGDIANIAHLRNRDFEFIKHDVTNYIYIDGPVDYVLHWASPASPIDYLELPIPTLKVGALGTHKALGLAKAKGARFVLASTSEVYGDPLEHPQKETYWGNVNPIGPRGVYDEAKRFAEAMTVAYHRYHGLDAKIVRIFNTYGPRMRVKDGRAVPAFISQALRNEDVTVFGDGRQTRSFTYITDLVDGIIRLMTSSVNEPVNIGNPREMTLEELAKRIIEMTESTSRIVYRPLPVDDPKVRQPDITKARTLLGWEPRVPVEEGLATTIDYFRTKLQSS